MSKAQKARDIIAKYPTLSKKELGKLLYNENKLLFKDDEEGRTYIRIVTGASNKKDGVKQTDKYIGRLPEGEKNDFSPFVLKGKRVGILCDIHIPYHDLEALRLALQDLKEWGIDTLVLDGDIIDCYSLSHWERDPSKRNHQQEMELLLIFLDDLIEYFPGVTIVLKLGNHSERYERFIMQKTPEFLGFHVLNWKHLLNLKIVRCKKCEGSGLIDGVECTACVKGIIQAHTDRGIHLVKDKRIIKAGKLNILHGHETGKGITDPVNPARGFFLKTKTNTIGGHYHRTSEHIESDMDGNVIGCWSIGGLCDMHPLYRPINKWNLGFAKVKIDGSDFEVHNLKIINGKIR